MIVIYDEGGRQQRQQAIHVGSIFYFHSPDILLTPPIHDFFRAQGGAAVAAVRTRSIYDEGGRQQ